MCEAMKMLMKDEIQESRLEDERKGRQEGRQEGMKEGEQKGALMTLFGLVKDGILTITDAAKRAGMNAADFERAYKTHIKRRAQTVTFTFTLTLTSFIMKARRITRIVNPPVLTVGRDSP